MGNSLSRPNTFINKPSFSSAVSIELAILPGNSTPDSPISASEASQRQDPIQEVLFADETGIVKAWIQPHGKLKRVRLNQVCLSDKVLWCLIDLSLERLRLHKCTFDMTKPSHLIGLFKFLADENSSKSYFEFAVHFKERTTQWILCNELSNLEFNEYLPISSWLIIPSGNPLGQLPLKSISSLAFLST